MEHWYVLRTTEKKEQEAAELLTRFTDHRLWSECSILKKIRVFRSGGILHMLTDVLFPGYLFIQTECPKKLAEEMQKSGEFPQFLQNGVWDAHNPHGHKQWDGDMIAAVAKEDLRFLKSICGEKLQRPMGISSIVLNEENQIIQAEGVLSSYLDRIVKLNLHKRFVIVEVPLFNRMQPILFGVQLKQDQAV